LRRQYKKEILIVLAKKCLRPPNIDCAFFHVSSALRAFAARKPTK
jgi:hypothetical protein